MRTAIESASWATPAAETAHVKNPVDSRGARIRAIIVDDSPASRRLLGLFLGRMAIEVVAEADNGIDAISLCRRHSPDIVFLDIVMPRMGGTEVLREIRQSCPAAKAVIVSSISDRQTVLAAQQLGANAYVIKPYDHRKLSARVDHALGR